MEKIKVNLVLIILFVVSHGFAQTNPVIDVFPNGTVLHGNIPYNDDELQKHLLDIYLPPNATGKIPLVVFVHGGWMVS